MVTELKCIIREERDVERHPSGNFMKYKFSIISDSGYEFEPFEYHNQKIISPVQLERTGYDDRYIASVEAQCRQELIQELFERKK